MSQRERTTHASQVFRWYDQVNGDPELRKSAFATAYAIASHINSKTGEGFPSTKRLAQVACMSQSMIIENVRLLIERGHLGVVPGRQGRGHPNRYRMILKPGDAAEPDSPDTSDTSDSLDTSGRGHVVHTETSARHVQNLGRARQKLGRARQNLGGSI